MKNSLKKPSVKLKLSNPSKCLLGVFTGLIVINTQAQDESLENLMGLQTIPQDTLVELQDTSDISDTASIVDTQISPAVDSLVVAQVDSTNSNNSTDTTATTNTTDSIPAPQVELSQEPIVEPKVEPTAQSTQETDTLAATPTTATTAASPTPVLEETYERLDATRITGRKKSFVQEQKGAASHLGKDVILQTQPVGTQELLEKVPGVQSASDDGMGNSRLSIGIRGLNPRRSARVLVLEDGIPIQPGAYIYPNMYYNPPVERLEEVEILKGSGSILYGPQNMGGVVNYITRKPRLTPGGMLALTGGTQGLFSTYVEYGGFGNQVYQPEVQLLYKQGEGFRENNHFDQINTTFKLNWSPTEDQDYYFKLNYNNENTHATYTGLTEYSFENDPWFNPKDQDVFEVERLALDVIRNDYSTSGVIETTKAYLNWFDRKWYRENDVFVSDADYQSYLSGQIEFQDLNQLSPSNRREDIIRVGDRSSSFGILREFHVAGVERSWLIDQGQDNELELGIRGHFERFHNERREGDSGLNGEFDVKDIHLTKVDTSGELVAYNNNVQSEVFETKSVALFAQERLQFDRLGVEVGTRFELFEQQKVDLLDGAKMVDKVTMVHSEIDPFGQAFKLRLPFLLSLGASYDLSSQGVERQLFAGTHSGFTPPSSSALNPNIFDVSESGEGFDVGAEESWTSELGYRYDNSYLKYEVSLFQLDIENQISIERSTLLSEAARTQSRGLEFMAQYLWDGGQSVQDYRQYIPDPHMTYTLMKSEVLDGKMDLKDADGNIVETLDLASNELAYVPRHQVQVGLSKKLITGEESFLKFQVDWKYKSSSYADIQNKEDSKNLGIEGRIPATPHTSVNMSWLTGDQYQLALILPELIDLSLTYQVSKTLEVFSAVKNVYGHTYIGSRLHSTPLQKEAHKSSGIITAPGRQMQLGMRYKF